MAVIIKNSYHVCFFLQIVFRNLILANFAESFIIHLTQFVKAALVKTIVFNLKEIILFQLLAPLCFARIITWLGLCKLCCLNRETIDSIFCVYELPFLEI